MILHNKLGLAIIGALLLLILAGIAGGVFAGDLDPPGPVSSTQVDLIFQPADCSAFPITLNQPGSYRFAQAITMPASCAKNGVEISVTGVSLDMGGFGLQGSSVGLTGIHITAYGINVSNGSVDHWTSWGIDASTVGLSGFHGLGVTNNAGGGMNIGWSSAVDGAVVVSNAVVGIQGTDSNGISTCLVYATTGSPGDGISLHDANHVEGCTLSTNAGAGVTMNDANGIEKCHSGLNSKQGINAANRNIIKGCSISANTRESIVAGNGSNIFENTIYYASALEIDAIKLSGGGTRVEGNTVQSAAFPNYGANGIDGLSGDGYLIKDNDVRGFHGAGINLSGNSNLVDGNHVGQNFFGGITASGNRAQITNNEVTGNTGLGMQISGRGNDVSDNTVTSNGGVAGISVVAGATFTTVERNFIDGGGTETNCIILGGTNSVMTSNRGGGTTAACFNNSGGASNVVGPTEGSGTGTNPPVSPYANVHIGP
jgi:hypothetical protein